MTAFLGLASLEGSNWRKERSRQFRLYLRLFGLAHRHWRRRYVDHVGRRLDHHENHVHPVGILAGDHLVGRVVDEGEAAVGLDDPGGYRVGYMRRVDVLAAIFDRETDGDLAGAGYGLAGDERGMDVLIRHVPELDLDHGTGRKCDPLPVRDRARYQPGILAGGDLPYPRAR